MAKVMLICRLGADAEKKIANGKELLNFNVAENSIKTDSQTGEVTEITQWYQCTMFTKSEKLQKHLVKGAQVVVEGKLSFEDYRNKNGVIVHGKKILVTDLHLIDFVKDDNKDKHYNDVPNPVSTEDVIDQYNDLP